MSKSNGIVVYDGPSMIDGRPIICIITGFSRRSKNPKTGNMLQSFILRKHVNPVHAWKNGQDKSICGDCLHRQLKSCYVNVAQAPNNVYKAFHNHKYDYLTIDNIHRFLGRELRIGSYGDPKAVPIEIWDRISPFVSGANGYSHQWKNADKGLKKYCMASCDTLDETKQAQKKGWRTFRISLPWEQKQQNEFVCPASDEGGNKTTCDKCLACGGIASKAKKNPIIKAHGSFGKGLRFERIMRLKKNKKKFKHLIPNVK